MYSPGVERALHVALEAHAGQTRKGLDAGPYVVHPLHVALMLARFDVDEGAIQAALLHDVVEDCPEWSLARVAAEFGPRVASIVDELSEDKSRPWAERKQAAIDKVPRLSVEALDLKACDKLHNLESLARDLERATDRTRVWSRFSGSPERTLVLSRTLVDALVGRTHARLAAALTEAMARLERLVGVPRG